MNLFFYLLACAGATSIVCHGRIFRWFRDAIERAGLKHKLPFHCPQCLGFWVGIAFRLPLGDQLPMGDSIFVLFLYGCAASLVSYYAAMTLGDEGLRVKNL